MNYFFTLRFVNFRLQFVPIFLFFMLLPLTGYSQDSSTAMIVLDASGSMWGQLDGKNKITIARETLDAVIGEIPESVHLGLMVYGHTEKGNCNDIEVIVNPAANAAEKIKSAVAQINPKGKTPLTESVKRAAEKLRYTEEKATVILITDGIETCHADPCVLASELQNNGVDFTAHVVGFDLSEKEGKEVACLAEETGGMYLGADNAQQLGEALQLAVSEGIPQEEIIEKPAASLSAPEQVMQAGKIEVGWEGPGDRYDAVQIYDPKANDGDGKVIRAKRLRNDDFQNRKLRLPAPGEAGNYLLRYWNGDNKSVLYTKKLEVIEAHVTLEAPEEIESGRTLRVVWQGPGGRYDAVQIYDPQANDGEGKVIRAKRLRNDKFEQKKVSLPAPGKEGMYQLRYWNGDNKAVLYQQQITIVDTP